MDSAQVVEPLRISASFRILQAGQFGVSRRLACRHEVRLTAEIMQAEFVLDLCVCTVQKSGQTLFPILEHATLANLSGSESLLVDKATSLHCKRRGDEPIVTTYADYLHQRQLMLTN